MNSQRSKSKWEVSTAEILATSFPEPKPSWLWKLVPIMTSQPRRKCQGESGWPYKNCIQLSRSAGVGEPNQTIVVQCFQSNSRTVRVKEIIHIILHVSREPFPCREHPRLPPEAPRPRPSASAGHLHLSADSVPFTNTAAPTAGHRRLNETARCWPFDVDPLSTRSNRPACPFLPPYTNA